MKLKFIYFGVITTLILSSCGSDNSIGPSACDCVIFFDSKAFLEEIYDGKWTTEDEKNMEIAKNCFIKFGGLTEKEKETVKNREYNSDDLFMDPKLGGAIEEARKVCDK